MIVVEKLLRQFEATCGQELSVDMTTGPLREALTILREVKDARAAEVLFDVNLFETSKPYTGKERFFPSVSKPDGAGEDWRPQSEPYPRDALEYFARRTCETGNHLCRALYSDFLWSRREWKKGRIELLITAVTSYLSASDSAWSIEDKVIAETTGLNWLWRALYLSLSIKDQESLVRQSATKAAEFLRLTTVAGGTWTLDFLQHLADNADKIVEHVPSSLFLGTVNAMLEDRGRRLPGHYDLKCTLLGIKEKWHCTLGDSDEAKECRRQIARTYIEEAEQQEGTSPEGNFRAGLAFEEALKVYMSLNDSASEVAAIKPRMRTCFENAKGIYKAIEQKISVNTAVVERIVAHYSALAQEEALVSLAADHQLIPSLDSARAYAEACDGASVLMQFMEGSVHRDGLPIQQVNTKDQRIEKYTADYFNLRLFILADSLLSPIFDSLAQRFPNHRLGIAEQLTKSSCFDDRRMIVVNNGIDLYLAGNYIAAIHLLVFQIEGSLRDLLKTLGLSTFDYRVGQGQEVTLGKVIDTLEQMGARLEGMDEDFIALLRYFLQLDGLGPNLRNAVAHGFVQSESLTKQNTEILLLILLRISTLRQTAQPAESTPA